MGNDITRRKFVKVTTTAAGLTVGGALLGGCSAGASASSATTSESTTPGHMNNGWPTYQNAMNKAQKVDTAPDDSEALATFVVVSDSHLSLENQDYVDRVDNMFKDIAQFCPDNAAIIVNGDITNSGSMEEWQKFAELAEASGFKYPDDFVLVIGNHDQFDSSGGTQDVVNTSDNFREQVGLTNQPHPYYDRTVNGVHLILMGPDKFPDDSWVKFGITDEEVTWLDNLLDADLDVGKLSFVFMHEPLYKTVRNTEPGDWGHAWSLSDEDNDNLHSCIKKHPNVIFFTGHTHALPDTVQIEGEEPLYVGTGSIAYCVDDIEDDTSGSADISEYGSLGWEVTVWETHIRFRMRDFLNHKYSDLEYAVYKL